MAQVNLDTSEDGVWVTNGSDHGKPVRYKIRPLPVAVDRKLHSKAYGNAKARSLGRESATTSLERMREYTIQRAIYALVDTENFSVVVPNVEVAATFGQLLGVKVEPTPDLFLDGKWTDEIRSLVLSRGRSHAAWISNRADKLVEAEIRDEEEDNEGF